MGLGVPAQHADMVGGSAEALNLVVHNGEQILAVQQMRQLVLVVDWISSEVAKMVLDFLPFFDFVPRRESECLYTPVLVLIS